MEPVTNVTHYVCGPILEVGTITDNLDLMTTCGKQISGFLFRDLCTNFSEVTCKACLTSPSIYLDVLNRVNL